MNTNDVMSSVIEFIIENCESFKGTVTVESPLSDYIQNSVELIKVVVDIEERFDVHFENEELDLNNFRTVSDFIQIIEKKIDFQTSSNSKD